MLDFKLRILLISASVMLVVDLYSWQAVKRLLKKSPAKRLKRIRLIYFTIPILLLVLLALGLFVPALEDNKMLRTYVTSAFVIIYLSKIIASLFFLVDDLRRLFKWLSIKISPPKKVSNIPPPEGAISRSKFLSQAGLLVGSVPLILLTRGIVSNAYKYRIRKIPVHLPNLPAAFDGLQIVQISDIHSGSFMDKDAVKRGVDMIQDLQADVVFFTGDMVNNKTDEAYDYADVFEAIKAPMGVFSTLGNHDYGDYATWPSEQAKTDNLNALKQVHKDLGWNLLLNDHEVLSHGSSKVGIIGVENWGDRGRFQKYGDLVAAQKGMEAVPVKLLLSHDPSHWDAIIRPEHPDIDLTFSGHTHGMQFGIEIGNFKWSPSQYLYKQWAGLYQTGQQQIYVNRGFGFIGYPGRVGILPEITLFELKQS